MNKTTGFLVAIIVLLVASFSWYAAKHPDRGSEMRDEAEHGAIADDDVPLEPRILTADVDAKGLDKVALTVGVGEVHVGISSDDKLHVKVRLQQKDQEFLGFFHWTGRGMAKRMAAAAIAQKTSGGEIGFSLAYPDGNDQDDFKQDWEVQIPARLALDADMKVGDLVIDGVAGGLDATLNVGELGIDVPKGPLHAKVNIGEIRVTSGSAQHGKVELSSNIGDVVLNIDGKSAGSREHGGLGNRVSVDGDGADDMRLSINVGEVSLHIEPQGDKAGGGK